MISDYLKSIERLNHLPMGENGEWIFHSGMLFGSHLKWWVEGRRATAHEGIDILFYRNESGEIASIPSDLRVPAISRGIILNVCEDFLGKSVVVALESPDGFNPHCLGNRSTSNENSTLRARHQIRAMVYAHIVPEQTLDRGQSIEKGQVLGTIADTAMRKSGISAHLHLSFMTMPAHIDPLLLDWQRFTDTRQTDFLFYDPLSIDLESS